jgi:hypothetical protein
MHRELKIPKPGIFGFDESWVSHVAEADIDLHSGSDSTAHNCAIANICRPQDKGRWYRVQLEVWVARIKEDADYGQRARTCRNERGLPLAEKLILKGALWLTAWRALLSRATMDIDLLGRTSNPLERIRGLFSDRRFGQSAN